MFRLTNHEVWAVTARHGDRFGAQIATWVVPASLATGVTRAVLVLSPRNFTAELVLASGRLVLQLLAADQLDLLVRLGLSSGHDVDKLARLDRQASPSGLPVIAGTCGWAEMVVVDRMDGGDRIVLMADAVAQEDGPGHVPMRRIDAYASLDPATRDRLTAKRLRDGERDRALIRNLATRMS
jgi:flavin reductase (DIM6/NTAB) family NADH-FMN oxidoreductase RutF